MSWAKAAIEPTMEERSSVVVGTSEERNLIQMLVGYVVGSRIDDCGCVFLS